MRLNQVLLGIALLAACGDSNASNPRDSRDASSPTNGDGDGMGGDGDGDGDGDSRMDSGPGNGDGDDDGGGNGDGDSGSTDHDASQNQPVDDSGTPLTADQKLAKSVYDKMISCGVVTGVSAARPYNAGSVEDDYDRCLGNCIVNAPCQQLNGTICGTDGNDFAICAGNCTAAPADGFQCGDTAQTVIPHGLLCDQNKVSQITCPNGKDEDPTVCADQLFTCKDGDKVSKNFVCDGQRIQGSVSKGGCKDGSDENCCAQLCGQDFGCK